MAQTEHLPIYKRTYDLCLYLEQVVRSFPRYQKYTLGTDLRDAARRVLKLVVRAGSRQNKVDVLLELRETLEELKVLLRLGQDAHAFQKFASFEHAATLVVEIAKQNEGWLKHQRQAGGGTGAGGGSGRPGAVVSGPVEGHGQSRRVTPRGPTTPSAP
ncbi:four helix bundle protein [Candidatus Binatia bacterium]|nr:four helix bundle protein [Candidatus Binatia bacterium]